MKMVKFLFISAFLSIISLSVLYAKDGFTQKDRELLIKLAVKVEELDKRMSQMQHYMDKRFEQIDKRFETMEKNMNKRFEQVNKRFEQVDKRFEQVDKRFEQVDKRFEQVDKRFEEFGKRLGDLHNFLNMLLMVFGGLVAAVMGFALWDRQTIVAKSKEEAVKEIESDGKLKDLIKALKELAKKDDELATVLKKFGFL